MRSGVVRRTASGASQEDRLLRATHGAETWRGSLAGWSAQPVAAPPSSPRAAAASAAAWSRQLRLALTAPARAAAPPAAREGLRFVTLALLCALVAIAALVGAPQLKHRAKMSSPQLLTSFEAAGGVPVSLWTWPDTGFSVRAPRFARFQPLSGAAVAVFARSCSDLTLCYASGGLGSRCGPHHARLLLHRHRGAGRRRAASHAGVRARAMDIAACLR